MDKQTWTTYEAYMRDTGQYLEQAMVYRQQLNALLQGHGEREIDEYIAFFQQVQKDFITCLPEMLYGNLLASLTLEERQREVPAKMIDRVDSMATFISYWEEAKQKVWEMLFEYEPDSDSSFYCFIDDNNYSHVAVTYMFMVAVPKVDQKKMFLRFADCCLRRKDLLLAYRMLQNGWIVCGQDVEIKNILDQMQTILLAGK